jgi:hypothetical protein
MMQRRLALVCAALLGIASLASCSKTEAPPPPTAEPPKAAAPAPMPAPASAPTVNAELKQLAAEVYVFAYPLVLMDVTRDVESANTPPDAFRHQRTLPDATSATVVSPNVDLLQSQAWLDLSKGPVILSVPDTRGRYYLIELLDAWTNVAASLGKRTTGTGKGDFAIVGPHWKGPLPGGMSEVQSPTDLAWLIARIETTGGADRDVVSRNQNDLKLSRLAGQAKPAKKAGATAASVPAGVDAKATPRDLVAKMDAATFFTRFAMLLPGNPPAKEDAPMVAKIKKLGLEAGHPFDPDKLDPLSAKSVGEGIQSALDAIKTASQRSTGGDIRNGWRFDTALGRWGTDYGKRAVAAFNGLGLDAPEDAISLATYLDASGHRLEGANRYVLHFENGKAPPTDGFWSLSLYDEQQRFVANAQNRYSLGSTSRLKANADGSIDIVIQSADPGPDMASNWLPAPKGNFNLVLRVFWPKQAMIDGKWVAPGVRRAT